MIEERGVIGRGSDTGTVVEKENVIEKRNTGIMIRNTERGVEVHITNTAIRIGIAAAGREIVTIEIWTESTGTETENGTKDSDQQFCPAL